MSGAEAVKVLRRSGWWTAFPILLHATFGLLAEAETDGAGAILAGAMLASAMTVSVLRSKRFSFPAAAAAGAWPALLAARRGWYWALSMHSPASAAVWVAGVFGWKDAPGLLALALLLGASAVPGWYWKMMEADSSWPGDE